jgi:signal transduction histidine kinase
VRPLKIQKIALNLISNAIKYTPEGGSVKVGVKSEAADGGFISYILTVEDTGIGMSREFMERMYEPFAQEKRSDSVREIGTGLGLSIVKRYVDLMGGSIEAESRVHQGTRIRVSIPVSTGRPEWPDARRNRTALSPLRENTFFCVKTTI